MILQHERPNVYPNLLLKHITTACDITSHKITSTIYLYTQDTLQVLNVSGNNLDSLEDLECLKFLTQFMANDNQLSDIKELGQVFEAWYHLWRLDLMGNPVCHKAKYRDRLILIARNLGELLGIGCSVASEMLEDIILSYTCFPVSILVWIPGFR